MFTDNLCDKSEFTYFFLISLIIQQVQTTITTQINKPVNPIALTAKSSPKNGKKSNIAPQYHRTKNTIIIETAFLVIFFL